MQMSIMAYPTRDKEGRQCNVIQPGHIAILRYLSLGFNLSGILTQLYLVLLEREPTLHCHVCAFLHSVFAADHITGDNEDTDHDIRFMVFQEPMF